jgi:hypothetical protein
LRRKVRNFLSKLLCPLKGGNFHALVFSIFSNFFLPPSQRIPKILDQILNKNKFEKTPHNPRTRGVFLFFGWRHSLAKSNKKP